MASKLLIIIKVYLNEMRCQTLLESLVYNRCQSLDPPSFTRKIKL